MSQFKVVHSSPPPDDEAAVAQHHIAILEGLRNYMQHIADLRAGAGRPNRVELSQVDALDFAVKELRYDWEV